MADRHYVRCIVRGNALGESKEKKTPCVKIRLQAVPGANPILEGYAEDRTLWADLWLTDNTIESAIETLEKVLGWHGNSFAELNEPILEGIEVDAACEWEEVNGKWYEKVAFLNAPGGGGVKKLEDAQVKTVVSRLDALLSRSRQNSGSGTARATGRTTPTRPASTGRTASAPLPDDNVPPTGARRNDGKADEDFFA